MERGRVGTSPFLANHGYFVSTLSDDEDGDYWSEEGREEHHTETMWSPEIQKRNINRWTDFEHQSRHFSCNSDPTDSNIMYLSHLQLNKSRACSEASKYSLQRSHELLMARSIHEAGPEESSEISTVQPSNKKSVKVSDRKLLQYDIEPTREVVVTSRMTTNSANLEHGHTISGAVSNWTSNLEDAVGDDYPDPIDMELYYNQPQISSLHEAKKLKMKVHNNQANKHFTSNRVSSEPMICDWEDETRHADKDPCNSHSAMIQPQRDYTDITMDPTVYPFRKTACDQRDVITPQKQKQLPRHFKSLRCSQERGLHGSINLSTSADSPMLRSLDPVKNCGTISERGCLSRVTKHALDFLQKSHNSNDDQFSSYEKERKMQDTVPVSATMGRKHLRSSHHRRGYSKRQHQEARNEKGDARIRSEQVPSLIANPRVQNYREDIQTIANTEEAYFHDVSFQALGLAKEGVHWDQRNAFWTSPSPVESQATTQREHFNRKEQELSLMSTSNIPDYITAPERENSAATKIRNSKMVKHGAPSTQNVKEQLLSAINLARKDRQNSAQANASSSIANESGKEGKCLDVESPHSKCLRERQLQTLNVIDYKTPETDGRTMYRLMNRTEDTHRLAMDETYDRKGMTSNIDLISDVIASENPRTNVNTCKRKGGTISNSLPEKENTNQTTDTCVPSGLVGKESVGNRKLPATSTVTEDQKLQVRIYSPSQQVEEKDVEVQEQGKEPELFVESRSREVIQVDVKAPEQHTELALQSNRLLMLLRDLQVQRPAPGNCYENTSIISTKSEGMTDTAPQCGYLAQYLKMQNIGARGTRRLLTTRR